MMRQYILFIGFLTIVQSGVCQEPNDTIYNPIHQFFTQELLEDILTSPLDLVHQPIKNYTASSIYSDIQDGGYKEGKTPEKIYTYGIQTKGIYRAKKGTTFFGDIAIKKILYKNLSWNLSYQLPERGLMEDPHYFGVAKAADWNNQHYELTGGMVIPAISNRLHLLLQTTYQLANKFRVDFDPRPKIISNKLDFIVGVSYTLHPKHHIKTAVSYGYQNIDNTVDYSNKNKNTPANYESYVKWLSGYGSLVNTFNNTTQRDIKNYTTRLGYALTTPSLHVYADVQYTINKQTTYRNNTVADKDDLSNYFATYEPQELQASVLGVYNYSDSKKIKIKVQGTTKKGENYWNSKGGTTYSSEMNSALASLAYLQLYDAQRFWDISTTITYWQASQKDALATTQSAYSNLEISNHILRSFALSKSLTLSPFIKSTIRINTDATYLQGNAQELENIEENNFAAYTQRDFYNQVILPDTELYGTHQLDLHAGTVIHLSTHKKNTLSLHLQAGMAQPLQTMKQFNSSHPSRFSGIINLTLSY